MPSFCLSPFFKNCFFKRLPESPPSCEFVKFSLGANQNYAIKCLGYRYLFVSLVCDSYTWIIVNIAFNSFLFCLILAENLLFSYCLMISFNHFLSCFFAVFLTLNTTFTLKNIVLVFYVVKTANMQLAGKKGMSKGLWKILYSHSLLPKSNSKGMSTFGPMLLSSLIKGQTIHY